MKIQYKFYHFLAAGLFILFVLSCNIRMNSSYRSVYSDYNTYLHANDTQTNYLKVHYKNGFVSVFNNWELNPSEDTLSGNGKLFNIRREVDKEGEIKVPLNEIAIIETNQLDQIKDRKNKRVSALTILTAVDVIIGVICISVPKACFGSCPTFYLNDNENVLTANAEGFSNSISPSLESRDIDALNFWTNSQNLHLTMKNEALETHAINEIQIFAAATPKDKQVYHSIHDRFYQVENVTGCNQAFVNDINISSQINDIDESEYFSLSDSTNLWEKEEIILGFKNKPTDALGLIVNFRQTLLTTFLLYNGLSYMGDEVGDYFSKIETNSLIRKKLGNPFKKMGGINVYYYDEKKQKWIFTDEIYETGPIAKNLQFVPLTNFSNQESEIKIKLEMTRGMWRIDYAALAEINYEIIPEIISLSELKKNNLPDFESMQMVSCDDENYLVSFPGDKFDLYFNLPQTTSENQGYQIFLSSKGYYLEWIRESWLEGKNTAKLEQMLLNDKQTWRELAVEYKMHESQMEELFWNSKLETVQ